MHLNALLALPAASWVATRQRAEALAHPGCWPHDPALDALARAHGHAPPAPPAVGTALLVAVAPGRSTLFALRRAVYPSALACPQGPHLLAALRLAEALAPATLPLLVPDAAAKREGAWEVVRVYCAGGGESLGADGASFGLAMLLAVASEWLDTPVPADLVALAALDPTGRTAVVNHLDQKLTLLRGSALGVRRVLVATAQRDEALRHAGPLEVVAVDDAVEALGVAFTGLASRLRARWERPDAAEQAAEALLKLALIPPRNKTLHWWALVDCAAHLCDALHDRPVALERAAFARAIAARHAGDAGPLPWPSAALLAGLSPSRRMRCVAQGVQAAADAGHADVRARAAEALAVLDAQEGHTVEALELRGAVGRALAAVRAYPEARDTLQAAVEGWWALDAEVNASFALCELVRVCGLLDDRDGLDHALRRVRTYASDHPQETLALAFLRLAEGRALVHTGRPAEALAVLHPLDAQVLPAHLRAAALRWQANAHAALGAREAARALRESLAAMHTVVGAAALAALDAALDADADAATLAARVEALEALRPQGLHGLLGPGTPHERAARIAREYPY